MKLNPDVVRALLIYISDNLDYKDKDSACPEKRETLGKYSIVTNEYFSKYNRSEISYALELLIAENYVTTANKPQYNSAGNLTIANINGLSMKGHELLNDIKDETFWNKAKERAAKVGGLSLGALAAGAKAIATAWMTEPNAVNNLVEGVKSILK